MLQELGGGRDHPNAEEQVPPSALSKPTYTCHASAAVQAITAKPHVGAPIDANRHSPPNQDRLVDVDVERRKPVAVIREESRTRSVTCVTLATQDDGSL